MATGMDGTSWDTVRDFSMLSSGQMMVVTNEFHGLYAHISSCSSGATTFVQNARAPNMCICPEGSWNDGTGQCMPCRECPSGTYVQAACSATANTVCLPCSQCSVGEWVEKECSALSGNTQCSPCLDTSCPAGSWMAGGCTGVERGGHLQCQPCGVCPLDHYVVSDNGCDGSSLQALAPICAPCGLPGGCGEGQYRSGRCAGTERNDTEVCVDCPLCPVGQYWAKGCDGKGFSPVEAVCKPCDACPAGSYIKSYQSCLGFRTTPTAYLCANCTACQQGQRQGKVCTGLTTADSTCVPCDVKCGAGQRVVSDPVGRSCKCEECRGDCGAGEFQNPYGCPGYGQLDDRCLLCTSAEACRTSDEYLLERGACDGKGAQDSRECVSCESIDCEPGYWADASLCDSDAPYRSWCKPCHAFCAEGMYRVQPCNGIDRDIVCRNCTTEPCPAGKYESTPCDGLTDRVCESCTVCSWPKYYDNSTSKCQGGRSDRQCLRCSECPLGLTQVQACTPTEDTKCGPGIGKG